MFLNKFGLRLSSLLAVITLSVVVLLLAPAAFSQDWFRTGTGLGSTQMPRIAVPDFVPKTDPARAHGTLFTTVVRDDLAFSGIIELASPSFYPTTAPSQPGELQMLQWSQPPVNANFLAFGNLTETSSEVAIFAWMFDVRSTSSQAIIGKVYRGAPTDAQVRKFAHQFADEIIRQLSGGLPSIASTQIAFIRGNYGNKELWVMDYDGANQHQLTSLHSVALTPRWSPDASRIAFTCFVPVSGVVSAQICMYSFDANKLVSFARYRGTNNSPTWSPDGMQVMFSSSMQGNPALYVTDASGNRPKRITLRCKWRGHVAGVESENGTDRSVCERSRRRAATLYDERGRHRYAQTRSGGYGLRDRPGVVAERATSGVFVAASLWKLRHLYR